MFGDFFQPLHMLMLFIVFLIFGPLVLPELAAGLVKVVREFVKSMSSGKLVAVLDREEDKNS